MPDAEKEIHPPDRRGDHVRYFRVFVSRVSLLTRDTGAFFLFCVMAVIVFNVMYRVVGGIVPGTYDLVEMLIVPAIAFALVTVEFAKRHTMVDMIVTRLPSTARLWVEVAMTLISLTFWSTVCWASYWITLEKMRVGEKTDTLGISIIPVRWLWVFALGWLIVVIVLNIYNLIAEIAGRK